MECSEDFGKRPPPQARSSDRLEALSFVEQDGVEPTPEDRGAEQWDVDGLQSAAWLQQW